MTWITQVGGKYLAQINFSFLYFLIFILVCIYPSIHLNKKHLLNKPSHRPFAWGYFLALVVISWGLLIGVLSIAVYPNSGPDWMRFWSIYLVTLGVLMYRQNRWAWLVYVIFSVNPVEWVINGFYLKNRWKDMRGYVKK